MGNQRLLLREGEIQGLSEKVPKLTFDLFGFLSWPCKAEEHVIGIAQVAQASVVGVCGVMEGRCCWRFRSALASFRCPAFFRRRASCWTRMYAMFGLRRWPLLYIGMSTVSTKLSSLLR